MNERYSRQEILPQIGAHGQAALGDSHALIVGAGGLGSAAALYLAGAGVGELTIADGDQVALSNLQRQIVHTEARLGMNKAESARTAVEAFNSACRINACPSMLDGDTLGAAVAAADVALDCSDNFSTRHALNAACVAQRTPLVSGAALGFAGQLFATHPGRGELPCYECLYPAQGEARESCETAGIIAPLVGVIGSLQALTAVRILVQPQPPGLGVLHTYDGLTDRWRQARVVRDESCAVCGR